MPYCFSRSYVKFQGHTALKIIEFDTNWAFPDCNSSLNSPMAMKCCTKLETAKERCPIIFQGHPSNFKVTRYKTSPILTQIGRFWTIGRSQLSNPSDLPCFISFPTAWWSVVIPHTWYSNFVISHHFSQFPFECKKKLKKKSFPFVAKQTATGQCRYCHAVVSSCAIKQFLFSKVARLLQSC